MQGGVFSSADFLRECTGLGEATVVGTIPVQEVEAPSHSFSFFLPVDFIAGRCWQWREFLWRDSGLESRPPVPQALSFGISECGRILDSSISDSRWEVVFLNPPTGKKYPEYNKLANQGEVSYKSFLQCAPLLHTVGVLKGKVF